jgi:hypothetical protein
VARAGDSDLDRIEDVLQALRALPGVTEKKRGVFYRGREAFAHFHVEDGVVLADVKLTPGGGFERYPLGTRMERAKFIGAVPIRHPT